MRSNLNVDDRGDRRPLRTAAVLYRFASPSGADNEGSEGPAAGSDAVAREELPYKVELWNAAKTAVEQLLAVTANGGIGYAAFYGATREFPHRYITLRHRNSIISRWNGPQH